MAEEEKKKKFINKLALGAHEIGASGKKVKPSTPFNSKKQSNKKGWEYQAETANLMEEINALIEGRNPVNQIPKILTDRFCRYCHKKLNPGNTSGFCNKRCKTIFGERGPLPLEKED